MLWDKLINVTYHVIWQEDKFLPTYCALHAPELTTF